MDRRLPKWDEAVAGIKGAGLSGLSRNGDQVGLPAAKEGGQADEAKKNILRLRFLSNHSGTTWC